MRKPKIRIVNAWRRLLAGVSLLVFAVVCNISLAYPTYSDCQSCHGDFRGSTSTKGTVFPSGENHEMHRGSTSMATACNLCHSGTSRTPVYIKSSTGTANNQGLGCTGCHVASGLRAHHVANGVTECYDCHVPETPPAENVSPPYYGTGDTKVRNPLNGVLAANTNENWSVGDFLGLDNDGNGLYDAGDFASGRYQILSINPEGNNVRITWKTAGGRTDAVQASGALTGPFADVGSPLAIRGIGVVTTNYVEVGGATNKPARFYRIRFVP
jgi:hypothetical protein